MAKLKQHHFYYGAILDAIYQYNPDASPTLVSKGDEGRQIYKLTMGMSPDTYVFLKYASPNSNAKNKDTSSFSFAFTDEDKRKLKNLNEKSDNPVLLYLLCKQQDLKDCEIAILKYEEYLMVEENKTITIRIEKNKNNFLLFRAGNKSKANAIRIPRNRIEWTFTQLLEESV